MPLLVASVEHVTRRRCTGYYGYAEILTEMRTVEHERVEKLLEVVHDRAAEAGVECETLPLEGLRRTEHLRASRPSATCDC